MKRLSVAFLFLFAVVLVACGPLASDQDTDREPIAGFDALLEALRAEGAAVEVGEPISQEFFSVEGRTFTLGGEQIQVFEYADEAAAAADAKLISPDGSTVGTTMITWVAPPHFFRTGRLLVLYLGDNAETLSLLETLLGPQIAGA